MMNSLSGEWNTTTVFNKSFKNLSIFHYLNTNVEGRGRVSFDSFIEKFRISGVGEAMVSSFFTVKEI